MSLRTLANSLRQRTEILVKNWLQVHQLARALAVTLQTGDDPEDQRFEGDIIFCTIDQMLSSFMNIPYFVGRGSAKSLQQQSSVWGLTTNGESYRFVRVMRGNSCTYQILPELNLIERGRSSELLQVLKAICKLQNVQLQIV
ncbi:MULTISPECIES: hypothetical protein [unclassified Tychonema]|uniref:hypothetical protein n=1 Tax=Tychonema sp. LEGE 07196 TaxID=1828665 RepID=UPI001D15A295|nr:MULTISPECIES: hypothetical protein [unclassified Tychonema]